MVTVFAGDAPSRVRLVRSWERLAGGDIPGSRGAARPADRGVLAVIEPFSLLAKFVFGFFALPRGVVDSSCP